MGIPFLEDAVVADFSNIVPSNRRSPSEEGYYKVQLVQCSEPRETQNGNLRVRITGQVLEGPAKGTTISDGFNLPDPEDEDYNKRIMGFWMALMESIGKAKQAKLKFSWATFKGQTAYCHYKPKRGEGTWPETTWLAKETWQAFQEAEAEVAKDDDVSLSFDDAPVAEEAPAPKATGKSPLDALDDLL